MKDLSRRVGSKGGPHVFVRVPARTDWRGGVRPGWRGARLDALSIRTPIEPNTRAADRSDGAERSGWPSASSRTAGRSDRQCSGQAVGMNSNRGSTSHRVQHVRCSGDLGATSLH